MTAPLFRIDRVSKSFGALVVAQGIALDLDKGARHALIGPNGAGKTTLINLITGILEPDAGRVLLDGHDISRHGAAARVKRGIVRTFQINQLFATMTVVENVAMALGERDGLSWNPLRAYSSQRAGFAEALTILDGLGLAPFALETVGRLSYGRRRLVELAIAMALKPRVLLLDEPAAGVPSLETGLILDCLARLDPDIAILLIDHDMDLVFRFATRISVLVAGAIFASGTPDEIAGHPGVKQIYFGEAA